MNIGQIARNQKMLYNIANKTVNSGYSAKPSASSSKLSAYNGLLNGFGSSTKDDGNNFFSSPAALKGTVRQIARRLYDASFSADAGTKVESQQPVYQPDPTTLSGNFEQLQALAQSRINRLQTVNLSDETTKKIQELALKDAKISAGAQEDTSGRLDMIQEEIQKFAPSKRSAALNTINKVWGSELDRIGSYIQEKDPNWTIWGDKFDVSILDDYKAGVNVWM